MSDTDDEGKNGTGLTLRQLVLEVRQDVRWLRTAIDNKVEKTEFMLLKDRFDRAMAGETTSAYAKTMMEEYANLKTSVKRLETADQKAESAKEIAEKTRITTDSNRKWIIGLVLATVLQAASLVYSLAQRAP